MQRWRTAGCFASLQQRGKAQCSCQPAWIFTEMLIAFSSKPTGNKHVYFPGPKIGFSFLPITNLGFSNPNLLSTCWNLIQTGVMQALALSCFVPFAPLHWLQDPCKALCAPWTSCRMEQQLHPARTSLGCCQSKSEGVQPSRHRDTAITELL